MSWKAQKSAEGDFEIVIGGWEEGIAPSPHINKGLADMKNVNISSVSGEVSMAYNRVRLDQEGLTAQNGTATSGSTDFGYTGTIQLGTWIKITSVSASFGLSNNHYYQVVNLFPNAFQLSSTFGGTAISATAAGTFTFETLAMGEPVDWAAENSGAVSGHSYRYYILDKNGVIWVSGTSTTPGASPSPLSSTMVWSAITPHGTTPYINGSSRPTFTYGGSICIIYSTTSSNVLSKSYLLVLSDTNPYIFENTTGWPSNTGSDLTPWSAFSFSYNDVPHKCILAYDQTVYFTDGPTVGVIREKPSYNLYTTAALASGATSATLTSVWTEASTTNDVTFSDGQKISVTFTQNSAAVSWSTALTTSCTNALSIQKQTFDPTNSSTYDAITSNYLLPPEDTATQISQLSALGGATSIIVGGYLNYLYTFPTLAQQTTPDPLSITFMPEAYTQELVPVTNYMLVFCGHKGNIYLYSGNTVVPILTIPDYVAGAENFVQDPYYVWGGAMYLRGRVFFSIQDQNSNHTGNCGGVWSFVPSISYFANQDVGRALRFEGGSSLWSTEGYNGYAPILFSGLDNDAQSADGPQYIAAWSQGPNDNMHSVNSIDFSGTTPITGTNQMRIETEAIPIGTFLNPKTWSQFEIKLSAALATGESLAVNYRTDLNEAWKSAGTVIYSNTPGAGNIGKLSALVQGLNFQGVQIVQFQVTATGTATNPSWVRMRNFYLR